MTLKTEVVLGADGTAEASAVTEVALVAEVASVDDAMTIDLSIAEQAPLVIDLDRLFAESTTREPPCETPGEEGDAPQQLGALDQGEGQLP